MKLLVTLPCALLCTLSLVLPAALAQTTINVGPGQSYTTIQSGIDAANNGDTVLVAPGTYNENIDFKGKAITVTSSGGAAVTTISGPNKTAAVLFLNGETRSSVLSNFTITGGGQYYLNYMGGIYIYQSSPSILNNVITKTTCYGILSSASSPLIERNEISYVQAQPYECSFASGAGIWVSGQRTGIEPQVIGNTIENNTESGVEDAGGNGGAGIAVWYSNVVIQNNVIRNNATGKYFSPGGGGEGGAILFWSGSGLVANNLIYGNTSNYAGGGIALLQFIGSNSTLTFVNNTVVDNAIVPVTTYSQPVDGGQQLYFEVSTGSTITFANNIISGSTADATIVCNTDPDFLVTFESNDFHNSSGPTIGGSTLCTYPAGTSGNISADPLFLLSATSDYHLQLSSPAIDAGNNSALMLTEPYGVSVSTDLDGKPRVQDAKGNGCVIDMGVYEYPGSVSDCGVSVTETLTSSLNPAMAGQSVTFTAQLSATGGTPTGTIQFLDGTNILSTQTVSSAGSASITTSSLTVGSHTITANYQPTGSFDPATASLVQVIEGNATNTALTCLPNPINIYQTAQFTVTVTSAAGTPTGSVSFTDNGASLGTNNLAGGSTRLTYTGSTAGTHDITANYVPTGSFAASSATCSEVVNSLPTTSTLTVAPASSSYGSSIALTATVSPATLPGPSTPTGMVTFYNGASAIGASTLTGGVATLSTASLPGGSYSLTCMYGGSSIYSPSNCNAVSAIITAAATSISLSGSPDPGELNQTIKFTADVSSQSAPVGNGTVTFYDGNSLLGSSSVSASGAASITSSFTTVGTHNITAVYGGDADFSSSTSAVFKETIVAGDFSIDVVPGSATVYTGEAAAVKVSITSLQGFNQPLALACSGLPANATCSFNSATLPEGAGAANLVIQTAAPHKEAAVSAAMLSALTLLLLPGWRRRRRFLARLVVLSLVIGAGMGLSGCGSVSSITGGTPPGTYQIAVTATSVGNGTTLEHSAVVTLEVKSLF